MLGEVPHFPLPMPNKPIVLAGVGQGYDDLIDFEPSNFLTQLLSDDIDPQSFTSVERDPNE